MCLRLRVQILEVIDLDDLSRFQARLRPTLTRAAGRGCWMGRRDCPWGGTLYETRVMLNRFGLVLSRSFEPRDRGRRICLIACYY